MEDEKLFNLLISCESPETRKMIINYTFSEEMLFDIAMMARNHDDRIYAMHKMRNERLLAKIILHSQDSDLITATVSRITNLDIMSYLVRNNCKYKSKMLKKMTKLLDK